MRAICSEHCQQRLGIQVPGINSIGCICYIQLPMHIAAVHFTYVNLQMFVESLGIPGLEFGGPAVYPKSMNIQTRDVRPKLQ